MSNISNLDSMPIDEVWLLHQKIIQILLVRLTSEKRQLEKRLAQLCRDRKEEMRCSDPMESELKKDKPVKQRKYPKVLPKYRNPDQRSETWSGRGKQPRWMAQALLAGRSIEEFVITGLELIKNNPPGQQPDVLESN
jgi:DNA-binding protein H-NS